MHQSLYKEANTSTTRQIQTLKLVPIEQLYANLQSNVYVLTKHVLRSKYKDNKAICASHNEAKRSQKATLD